MNVLDAADHHQSHVHVSPVVLARLLNPVNGSALVRVLAAHRDFPLLCGVAASDSRVERRLVLQFSSFPVLPVKKYQQHSPQGRRVAVKSGSGSAVAFGRVLQAVRKHLSKNQADVASSFDPKLSVAAVSMAESGNRPPKTEAIVRGYAAALELDEDALFDLWRAMQGMVALESEAEERVVKQWWRELRPGLDASRDLDRAKAAAEAKRTPNDDYYAPSAALFALAAAICGILARMLGDSWKVSYKAEIGLREPSDGYLAVVNIELQAYESLEMMATFACPEPVTRPLPAELMRTKPQGGSSSDVGWILNALMAMPARERAAVAGFIHGLREGSSLYGAGEDK